MFIKKNISHLDPKLMFKKTLISFFMLFLFSNVNAQNSTDSLYEILYADTSKSISEKIAKSIERSVYYNDNELEKSIYCDQATYRFYIQQKEIEKAKETLDKIWKKQIKACDYKSADTSIALFLKHQIETNSSEELPDIYYDIALNKYNLSEYKKAQEYFKLALEQYKNTNDKQGIAKSMKGIAIVVSNWGDYEKAIGLMQNAREIYSELQDENGLAGIYISLGAIMQDWNKNDRAQDYYNQGLLYYKAKNDIPNQINSLLHIADIYLKQEKYKLAIQKNREAKNLEGNKTNKRLRSIALSNIGEAYYQIGQQDSALAYQKQALKIKLEVGDKKRIAISYSLIGSIYLTTSQLDSAEQYLTKSLLLCRKINFNDYELNTLKSLSKLYKKLNKIDLAFRFLSQYQKLSENTFTDKTNLILEELDIKYDSEKKDTEYQLLKQNNEIQELQIEKEKNSKFFTIIFATFIVFIAFALVFFVNFRIRLSRKNYSILSFKNKEITRQKEELSFLNKDLEESREKFKGIVENATIGIYRTNPAGEVLFANKYLTVTLGYNSFDDLKKIDVNANYENREEFLKDLEKNRAISGRENKWTKADGSEMFVLESAWIVPSPDGKIKYIEGLVEDITKRKKAELNLINSQNKLQESNKALKIKNSQVEEAIKEAKAANNAKSTFLANVSHEIRTPMNSIIGFTELLLKKEIDPKKQSYIKAIDSSSKSLLTLINDILDLSKIQAGKLTLVYETVSLPTIIDELEQIFSMQFKSKGLKFSVSTEKMERRFIKIDGVRLRQLLFNLVGNALKFTEAGEIKVDFSTKPIDAKTVDLEIVISDTGPGIPKKYQKQIFSAFSQGNIIGRDNKGSGLGLSISKQLAHLMKGELSLESNLNKGSTFTISFPETQFIKINRLAGIETAREISESDTIKFIDNSPTINTTDFNNLSEGLTLKIKNEFTIIFSKILNNRMMNDIESFANELENLAEKEKSEILLKYASTLKDAINKFDIDEIESLLLKINVLFD